jgi:hypothetical protein
MGVDGQNEGVCCACWALNNQQNGTGGCWDDGNLVMIEQLGCLRDLGEALRNPVEERNTKKRNTEESLVKAGQKFIKI